MKNLDQLLEQAVKNIKEDRAVTNAQYVETLQRSNEQLVKVGTLVHKKEQAGVGLSDAEKEEIYDLINNSTEEGTEDGD